MHIRQLFIGAILLAATATHAQHVVQLPGVSATASPEGCVSPASAGSAALSYSCLTRLVTAEATPKAPEIPGADISKRPSNTLGLYNASSLQNRMG